MGEGAKPEVEAKPTAEEAKKEEKEAPRSPTTTPIVLQVDLHCMGCAKKIERSIMRLKGVDWVMVDMGQNQINIKGTVDPQAACDKITKKLRRSARVLSPLPAAPPEAEPPKPDTVVASEKAGGGLPTVELTVNLHCEACAVQLKRKILKLRGVETVEVELSSGKVRATGTMDADKLVNYVYRRTRKQARIVPQPEPPKPAPEDEVKKGAEDDGKLIITGSEDANNEAAAAPSTQPQEEGKDKEGTGKEDNKTESATTAGDDKRDDQGSKEDKKDGGEKTATGDDPDVLVSPPAAAATLMMNNFGFHYCTDDEENMKKMMMTCYNHPLYVIERVPPPQLFSDENPNACCIS